MKRLIQHFVLIAAIALCAFAQDKPVTPAPTPAATPAPAAKSAQGTPSAITDPKEQEDLSRAMIALVLAQNNLLAERSKYPELLKMEAAAAKANQDYGTVLQASRVKHSAGPLCEIVAASKEWNCPASK